MLNTKLDELKAFYEDETKTACLIEGKAGANKSALFKAFEPSLGQDVLVFKFKCFEAATLDDIYLSVFEDLKKYASEKKISFAKMETASMSQRINNYLARLNKPAVVVIDSFENVFRKKNEEEKEEILNFFEHLESMNGFNNKFKIILISGFFDLTKLKLKKTQTIVMEPYSSEQVQEYFLKSGVIAAPEELIRFYEITRGNASYLYVTANIIITLKISLDDLLKEFSNKRISYEDFIYQKLITFVPEAVKKSLYMISLVNIGLSEDFLVNAGFFTKEQITYMLEKALLSKESGMIYLKSGFKKYLQSYIVHIEKLKIHKLWRDFYDSQLPLKPNDRIILLSRNTMRAQMVYHGAFLSSHLPPEKQERDFSLMSYANNTVSSWELKKSEGTMATQPSKGKEGLDKYQLTKDELSLLNTPIDMRRENEEAAAKEKVYRTIEQQEDEAQKQQDLSKLLEVAQSLEAVHSFDSAYGIYQNALDLKSDENYGKELPFILNKLAFCAKKMNNMSDAIVCYNSLVELYTAAGEKENTDLIRLEIADIYRQIFKINHARVIYENFINEKSPASPDVKARSFVAMGQIEEELSNNEKALGYYDKAVSILENEEKVSDFACEAYFKYALILDDYNRTAEALKYYEKSVKSAVKTSVYVSSSYTNMAEILREKGETVKALESYKKALKADLGLSNYEGIYYLCNNIGRLCETLHPAQVSNWLLKSLSAAKRTGQKPYIKRAYLELAKYYTSVKDTKKAAKAQAVAEGIKDE